MKFAQSYNLMDWLKIILRRKKAHKLYPARAFAPELTTVLFIGRG
jgi:hypothetical protein